MQSIDQYEAELDQGARERFESPNDAGTQKASNVVTFPQVSNVHSVDPDLLYNEEKLGCARGVIWAVFLEAAVIIVVAICWKLLFSSR